MSHGTADSSWRRPTLIATLVAAFITQNSIALPYVWRNGPKSVLNFFVGDIYKTVPGRFAMADLAFVVLGFHIWAFSEARRLGIIRWWAITFVMTFQWVSPPRFRSSCWSATSRSTKQQAGNELHPPPSSTRKIIAIRKVRGRSTAASGGSGGQRRGRGSSPMTRSGGRRPGVATPRVIRDAG
ncbi:DUF2834 domain-containing protein [Nocardia terpenica]|uniref:DUF2834 domain-containing protein n=1 Tax=Nocardia terpenica TaxID=455432 RepID=UPI002FDFCB0E